MVGSAQQVLEAIVLDPEEGKLRILFAGDLCQGLLVPVPSELSLGSSVTLRIRVRSPGGHQVFEGSTTVLKLEGGMLVEGAVRLRAGLMLAFVSPTFVRRRSPHDLPPRDDVFALPPDTLEERDPWSASGELDDTVKLPASEFWTGDTSKMPPAPRFSSLSKANLLDDEQSGPWSSASSTSSIIQ